MVEGLQRKSGQQYQAEVYRARLKGRMRGRGEPLPELAQDMESLVRRAYPTAPEDMVDVLASDHFVHALQQQQLQIYVKQAHPRDLREALARAMEFESFLHTTGCEEEAVRPRRDFRARRMQMEKPAAAKPTEAERTSAGEFRGSCWGCGERSHMRSRCPRGRRTHSLDRLPPYNFEFCCWSCGQLGHVSSACSQPKDIVQAGNGTGLGGGRTPASYPMAPRNVNCLYTAIRAVQVDGILDGKPCHMVVDTGAERTFVREDVVSMQHLPDARRRLCGVTGHCARLKGPVEAQVGVGSVEDRLPVYVADLEESCLLGLDYLLQSKACLDFGSLTLRVHGEEMPLLLHDASAEVVTTAPVYLAPGTEARVQCRLSQKMRGADGMVEPTKERQLGDGVAVGRSLVRAGEDLVNVLVANLSDKTRRIPVGAKLGICEEVERQMEQQEDEGSAGLTGQLGPLPGAEECHSSDGRPGRKDAVNPDPVC